MKVQTLHEFVHTIDYNMLQRIQYLHYKSVNSILRKEWEATSVLILNWKKHSVLNLFSKIFIYPDYS